jgi:hypothetical protein
MKSPFPGMDPWLEQHWGDVHSSFVVYARDQINEQLPADLQARVEESIAIDTGDQESRVVYPDVRVVEEATVFDEGTESGAVAVAIAEPVVVPVPDEPQTIRHIEIVDGSSGNRVVTAIELLSPANKVSDDGRQAYRQKQREYLAALVNLVEIDLIRAGKFVLAVPQSHLGKRCQTPYRICVRRVTRPDVALIYPVSLREPLPNIRIPLRPRDRAIVLQLQPVLDECYRRGRYHLLDYRKPLDPPLSADDQAWVDQLLSSRQSR